MDELIKYSRTYHLPISKPSKDDKVMDSLKGFENEDVVITKKMDGENTSLYRESMHARSLSYDYHPSREKMKKLWSVIRYHIPEGWRICGENLTALHSIKYEDLIAFFQVINIWEGNTCLSWKDTKDWCEYLRLPYVPIIYEGKWDEKELIRLIDSLDTSKDEGLVVRVTRSFLMSEFPYVVGKYVRPNHIQVNNGHWKSKSMIPNVVIYKDLELIEAMLFRGKNKA